MTRLLEPSQIESRAQFAASVRSEIQKIRIGERVTIHYPDSPLVEAEPAFRERRIVVKSVRDLVTFPLSCREYLNQPLTKRGRVLMTAWDTQLGELQTFYLSSCRAFWRDSFLRVGLYDGESRLPFKIIGEPCPPLRQERLQLAKRLMGLERRESEFLTVGVFADDLAVVAT